MKRISCSVLMVVALTGFQFSLASEEALNAVPVPTDATIEFVSINLLQNGHRLSIANLKPASSIDAVLEFYREQWQEPLAKDIPGYVEDTAGDWSIISRLHEGWNQVVQLRETDNGIKGRVSVMQLEASSAAPPAVAMPGNATLVSSTGAKDAGHQSSTYVVFSKSGVQTVADFYRRHFNEEGWSRVSDELMNNAQVMLMQRKGERAELVTSRMSSRGTLTIINKVMNDE